MYPIKYSPTASANFAIAPNPLVAQLQTLGELQTLGAQLQTLGTLQTLGAQLQILGVSPPPLLLRISNIEYRGFY